MSKLIIKTIAVFSSIFLLALSTFATEVDIAAENLEYIEADGKIIARDHVVLNWEDKKIYADNAELDINTKTINAYGNVKVEEPESIIRANAVSYDYNDETGEIDETFAYSSSVFMRSESMEKVDKDTFLLHNVKLSACDLDEPHTYFKAKYGKLILDKRITVYKATLYVGKMPIFYVPVFTKSLEKGKKGFGSNLRYEFLPGITPSYDHPTLKALIAFSLTENIYAKFKYDHSDKKCDEGEIEIDYENDDGNIRVGLDTYLSNNNNKKSWRVKPSYFHKLNDQWTLRSHVSAQNAGRLTKKYPDSVGSDVSFTRQGGGANISLEFDHNMDYDKESCLGYKMSSSKLPKVTFGTYGKDIGMGIIHDKRWEYSLDYDHYEYYYDYARPNRKQDDKKKYFFNHKALFEHKFITSLKISKKLTLKPGVEATGNLYSKDKAENCKGGCYAHYGYSLAPSYNPTEWMNWRATYRYKLRTKPNSLFLRDVDAKKGDKGIEINCLGFVNTMDFTQLEFCDSDTFEVTNTIKYNWLDQRSKYSYSWPNSISEQHLSPLKTELDWKPKDFFISSLKVEENHHLHPSFKFKDFELKAQIGNLEKNYLSFGVNLEKNILDTKHALGVKSTFGVGGWINPKWRIDYKISIDFSDKKPDKVTDRITEHEFRIYRDTHCWNCGIVWSRQRSFAFKFYLKTNMPFFNKSEDALNAEDSKDSEEIFYPWRGETYENPFDF